MKLRWHNIILLGGMMLLFSHCGVIFEEDIEDERIVVLAPVDSLNTTQNTVTFWWEEVDGATFYDFQIVNPRFDSVAQFIMDSNVVGNRFTVTFAAGTYQWRIRGANSAYETPFVTQTLIVKTDTTSDLSTQTVQIQFPPNNYITNDPHITFDWLLLENAENYRFEIAKPDFATGIIKLQEFPVQDTISYTFDSEGNFQWRIQAINSSSISPERTFDITIDTTAPATPFLSVPQVVADTVSFSWTRGNGALTDTVFIFPDSLISPAINKIAVSGNTLEYKSLSTGTFFSGVMSEDAAGNSSSLSNIRKFIVQ